MKPILYNQEGGDTERFLCPGTPQGPGWYQCGRNLNLSHRCLEELWLIKCFNSKTWPQTPLLSQIVSCSS